MSEENSRPSGEELHRLLDSHRTWLESEGRDGKKLDLSHANLIGANLSYANLSQADLSYTDLTGANLSAADLTGVNLTGANLTKADLSWKPTLIGLMSHMTNTKYKGNLHPTNLTNANLYSANLAETQLAGANLTKAMLAATNLTEANLREANLTEANLIGANLTKADLRQTKGLIPNDTNLHLARIDPQSKDPWSVLRRNYTGTKLVFHIVLLLAFFVPLSARTMYWVGVNNAQIEFAKVQVDILESLERSTNTHQAWNDLISVCKEEIGKLQPCLSAHCKKMLVWQVLLDFDKGGLLPLASGLILLYQMLRAFLTYRVGPLRDEEERSGWCPEHGRPVLMVPWWARKKLGVYLSNFDPIYREYESLYTLHRVARVLLWLAIGSFSLHLWTWLSSSVFVPWPR